MTGFDSWLSFQGCHGIGRDSPGETNLLPGCLTQCRYTAVNIKDKFNPVASPSPAQAGVPALPVLLLPFEI